MSAFPPNPAQYDIVTQPLTLCGKAAVLEHLTPRRDPVQAEQARQAASGALHTAFLTSAADPDASHPKGGI